MYMYMYGKVQLHPASLTSGDRIVHNMYMYRCNNTTNVSSHQIFQFRSIDVRLDPIRVKIYHFKISHHASIPYYNFDEDY